MSKDELVAIGKVIAPHGVKGEVKVSVYGTLDAFPFESVSTGARRAGPVLRVLKARGANDCFLVLFDGVVDRDGAKKLAGKELYVEREALPEPPEGEYYHVDLIGARVETIDGTDLGMVVEVIETGGNDVLEVKGPLGQVLIPAVDGVVKSVDVKGALIKVSLPDGLLPD